MKDFGPIISEHGVTFRLFSRHARNVWVMLFDRADTDTPITEASMVRKGDRWSLHLPQARPGMFYCFRVDGKKPMDPMQWLLDPYGEAIHWPTSWATPPVHKPGIRPRVGTSFPKSVIVQSSFDWGDVRPPEIPWEDMVIYETHVRGFTFDASSGVASPGTYRGLIEKIPYLKDLGVTSIELLPVFEFNENEFYITRDKRKDLVNFWGYNTLGFFAPKQQYASANQVDEFKELVKAIHAAGMEVILDVVYNHTGEGGPNGPIFSFRGIDEKIYYSISELGTYRNFSGCGNTVNCHHPIVRRFIIDSLRHWVEEYHIDGFRFDLAPILTRGPYGRIRKEAPLIEEIDEDPVLRPVKMIAEAWDTNTYMVGNWPSPRWSEWNGQYRDDVRDFWRGQGNLSAFATRLSGSDHLYEGKSPRTSINFVTCHDGFTLRDLVSYNEKHNEANLENSRDGESHNRSWNCGVEGEAVEPGVNALRLRQQKNFIATLMFSQGIPMLLAGDEFGRTQGGNNNAYCQDSKTSWVDWTLLETYADLHDFTRKAIALRKRFPSLRRPSFFTPSPPGEPHDVEWYGPGGTMPVWQTDQALAMLLCGKAKRTQAQSDCPDLLVIFNAAAVDHAFDLPATDSWTGVLTSNGEIEMKGGQVIVPRHSVVVMEAAV
jgi:isoamylase